MRSGIVVCLVLLGVFLLVPWSRPAPEVFPIGPGAGDLDPSWEFALHDAFHQRTAFGKDLVFTYGPLGFVYARGYSPATYWLTLALRGFLVSSLVIAIIRLLPVHWSPARRSGWVLAIICFLMAAPPDVEMLLIVLAFASLYLRGSDGPWVVCLGSAALSVLSLSKFSILLPSFATIGLLSLEQLLVRRRVSSAALFFGAWLLILWLLLGQQLRAFPEYLRNSLEVASGYTEALSLPLSRMAQLELWLSLFLSAGLIAAIFHAKREQPWMRRGCEVLILAGLIFLLLKASFVRSDPPHLREASVGLLIFVLLEVPTLSRAKGSPARVTGPALLILALINATLIGDHSGPTGVIGRLRVTMVTFARSVLSTIKAAPSRLMVEESYASTRAAIKAAYPLPNAAGTMDVYPWSASIVLANDAAYRPRPALQSYTAYTPRLLEMDAQHLRGAKAPQTILFSVSSIDHWYPSFNDSLSWPELLSRYEIVRSLGDFKVLTRLPAPGHFHLIPMSKLETSFGESSRVPGHAGQRIWARIDLSQTWWGKGVNAFGNMPPVMIRVMLENGQTRTFRFIPGIARAGFLLSPLVESNATFALLPGREEGSLRPLAVREWQLLRGDGELGSGPLYQPHLTVEYSELELTPAPSVLGH